MEFLNIGTFLEHRNKNFPRYRNHLKNENANVRHFVNFKRCSFVNSIGWKRWFLKSKISLNFSDDDVIIQIRNTVVDIIAPLVKANIGLGYHFNYRRGIFEYFKAIITWINIFLIVNNSLPITKLIIHSLQLNRRTRPRTDSKFDLFGLIFTKTKIFDSTFVIKTHIFPVVYIAVTLTGYISIYFDL